MMREYTSGQPTDLPDPVGFKLDGIDYVCRQLGPLELSEVARLQGQAADSPEAMAFMADFFRMALGAGQYHTFRENVGKFETRVDVFVEIIQGIFEDFANLPTSPPSDSSDGRLSTEPKSTGDSFSRVMSRLEGRPDLQMAVIDAASQ
jgi:hypothetical protein